MEIKRAKSKPFFVISWYRPPNRPAEIFEKLIETMLRELEAEGKKYHIVGDLNCNLLDQKNIHSRQLTDIYYGYLLVRTNYNRTNMNHN